MMLLGEPGGGKSTITRRMAGVLAKLGQPASKSLLDDFESAWVYQVEAAFGRWLLPVRIVMSRWVVVGAGVTMNGRRVVSDIDDDVASVASWVTPRLGGVGPMTRAMLLLNTLEAAERSLMR